MGKNGSCPIIYLRKRFKLEEGKCRADLKPQEFFQLLISESIV